MAGTRRPLIELSAAAALLALAGAGCQQAAPPLAARPWSLVASGDTAGWIAPCGCTVKQLGGLSRRATFVDGLRSTRDVVLVDVGGAAGGVSDYDELKLAAILRGEMAMGLAAHNVGRSEAALGPAVLRRAAAETQAPLVSANLRDAAGQLLFPPLRTVEAGGRRVALIGVISPALTGPGLHADEPAAAVLAALTGIQGKYDAAVVLAYLPAEELAALAGSLPEVDAVIGGPTRQTIEPRQVGPTLLAAVTNQGKFLARLDAPAAPGGEWQGRIIEMDATWPDNARQLANLTSFRRELARRDLPADRTSFAPELPAGLPTGLLAEYRLAGTDACRECHRQECESWTGTRHAVAWKTLTESGSQADAFCQQCHTTGFGLPGGFASVARSQAFTNVGCESCHGPSRAHASDPRAATTFAARDQCLRCHDHENSPTFAFERYWQRVQHGAGQPIPASADQSSGPGSTATH